MADTWAEYLWGSGDQRLADLERQRLELDKIKGSFEYQLYDRLRDQDLNGVDPRAMKMALVADQLYPGRTSDALNHETAAARYLLEAGERGRDTALMANYALQDGDFSRAASLAARAPVAMFYPPAGAGMRGQPDDWRENARRRGVGEGAILAFDVGTDPETWVTGGFSKLPKGMNTVANLAVPVIHQRALGKMARPLSRLIDAYRNVPADEAGSIIRSLRTPPAYRPMTPSMPME